MKKIFLILFLFTGNLSRAELTPAQSSLIDSLREKVATQPAEVIKTIDGLIAVSLSKHDSLMYAKLLDVKGLAKRNKGEYAESIKCYQSAYDIYNSLGNKRGIVGCLSSIGNVLIRTTQYDKAIKYFQDGLNLVDKTDTGMLKVLYTNLGVAYDYSDQTNLAIETYKKSGNYIKIDDDYSMGVLNLNIGVCYDMLKDFKKAEEYFLRALEYQGKTTNKDLLARIGISLGGMYLDHKQINKAIYYYELGGKAASEANSVELQQRYYENLIPLYITTNDSKKALHYIDKLNTLRTELYSSENSKNVAEAEAKFNLTIKNKEIENLKISKSLSDLKMERDGLIRNVMLVIILFSLILLFIVYRNYKLRQKNYSLLTREKQLVESEKKALEKNNEYLQNENILARFEILKSQVSPHFLFNTLNALSYLIESDSEKAVEFTNAFSKLYRTILELKDQNLITLEQELSHVKDYFFLQLTRFGDNLKISQQIDPGYLGLKLPPFSIQIAVENAINHNMVTKANPLVIEIYCTEKYLIIENNLQLKINAVKSTSMGIANIKSRYSFFTDTNPEFNRTDKSFIVKLPLLTGV